MAVPAEIKALVVTLDPWLVVTFTNVSRELGIDAEKTIDSEGIPRELSRVKYEALLLDFDTVSDMLPILARVRQSPSNKKALVFAVATGFEQRQQAFEHGANFVLERPFASTDMRRVLHAAYDLLARERRRYFRCTAELPVQLTRSNSALQISGKTINVSSSGAAVSSPSALDAGDIVEIALILEEVRATVFAHGTVVWDDKHGKTGLAFKCDSPEMQAELDSWLYVRFSELLRPRISN